jgi:hypothetical protein
MKGTCALKERSRLMDQPSLLFFVLSLINKRYVSVISLKGCCCFSAHGKHILAVHILCLL